MGYNKAFMLVQPSWAIGHITTDHHCILVTITIPENRLNKGEGPREKKSENDSL
jgi:hypothetical protein